jgi:hypothetical protein
MIEIKEKKSKLMRKEREKRAQSFFVVIRG